jgi:hypothetical protein
MTQKSRKSVLYDGQRYDLQKKTLKFRVFEYTTGAMFYYDPLTMIEADYTCIGGGGLYKDTLGEGKLYPDLCGSKFSELMQYVGLSDKHDNDLYEGDIVRIIRDNKLHDDFWYDGLKGKTGVVSWLPDGLQYWVELYWGEGERACYIEFLELSNAEWASICSGDSPVGSTELEVIGNIYENPELVGDS